MATMSTPSARHPVRHLWLTNDLSSNPVHRQTRPDTGVIPKNDPPVSLCPRGQTRIESAKATLTAGTKRLRPARFRFCREIKVVSAFAIRD
jgi:hypothetical protein